MIGIHLDFETRSNVDLKTATTHVYACDDSTDVWCMAYAIGDEPVQLWKLGDPFPAEILAVATSGEPYYFIAHNAPFELAIWNYLCVRKYGWSPLPAHRTYCTMAMAYAMALPGSLENAANATGMTERKDLEGRRLMLQMAAPRRVNADGTYTWWDDEQRKERLYAYCKNDVIVERELEKRLQPLSDRERQVWLLDYEINDRGLMLDVATIKRAMTTIASEKKRLDDAIHKVTKGMVKGSSDIINLKDFARFHHVKIDSLAKADIRDALAGELPPAVREALSLRQEGAKSSTAKLKAMWLGASSDNRIRGTMQYHGAGTGRWAGRKIQPHNMPRGELNLSEKDVEDVCAHIDQPDYLSAMHGAPLTVISDCLRGMIISKKDHDFIVADFSAIEARVLAWLAGQNDVLDVFRSGRDIYKVAAADIFGVDYDKVTKDQRAVGKVAILALGYQGGIGAFLVMAIGYGVDMSVAYSSLMARATAEQITKAENMFKQYVRKKCDLAKAVAADDWSDIPLQRVREWAGADPECQSYEVVIAADLTKQLWRQANASTVDYWENLNSAAMAAVMTPKTVYEVKIPGQHAHRQVRFIKSGSFLWCRLPSGRRLCYPYPQISEIRPPWAEDDSKETRPALIYMGVDSRTHAWQKQVAYGGLLAENITQAVARDFLVEAMFAVEKAGYKTVFHVHDEIVCEVPQDFGSVEELEQLITAPTAWGFDCPITAEGWRGNRYRK